MQYQERKSKGQEFYTQIRPMIATAVTHCGRLTEDYGYDDADELLDSP